METILIFEILMTYFTKVKRRLNPFYIMETILIQFIMMIVIG